MSRFSHAIFDMDGLLVDSERMFIEAWMAAAARRGIALDPARLVPAIGLVARDCAEVLAAAVGGWELAREIRAEIAGQPLPEPPLRPGAADLLARLREHRIACGVASSSRVQAIERRLRHHDLLRHLQAWAGGDEVPRAKPDPAVYLLAAQRLGAEPRHCLAFEDSDHGAEAALAAGMQVVLVPDLKSPSAALARRCLQVSSSLADIETWVLAAFGRG